MNLNDYINKEYNKRQRPLLNTNIKELDNILDGGIELGRLIEISGQPDIGKTTLLFDIIENIDNSKIVLYIATSSKSLQYLYKRKLDLKNNVIILISNREEEIIDYLNKTINNIDLIMIDSISDILTVNESISLNLKIQQDIPKLLRTFKNIVYGKDTSLLLINHITYKNNIEIPKWNSYFQQYCSIRLRLNKYNSKVKDIELISHKLKS